MRRISSTLGILVATALFSAPSVADADNLSDYLGPRELSVGESMRGAATGARAITLNPAGLTLAKQLVFEGSYGFRGEDGANSVAVSACDSTNRVPGCYYYRYFSAEPTVAGNKRKRRAHEFGMSLSKALSPRLAIGTTTKYFDYNTEMTGEEDASGFALDIGVVFNASKAISLGVVGHNIVAEDSSQYPRAAGVGLSIRPAPSLGLSVDGVWNLDSEEEDGSNGRFGGGAEYFYRAAGGMAGYPVRVGGVYDSMDGSTWVTGGLGYTNPRLGLDVGARKQVEGGDELLILAGLRFFTTTL